MSVKSKMTAIADSIRDKTGGTEALTLDEMASGVDKVYEAGAFAEEDKFWEKALSNGVSGMSFSGNVWNDETFKPTRDIICDSTNNGNWFFSGNRITSVKKALAIHNVTLNTKNLSSLGYAFMSLTTIDLPELDFSNIKNTNNFSYGLRGNANLVTIDKIILTENWNSISSFGGFMLGNSKLENIVFEGVIPATISFSACPLTVESIISIISCLKDYSGTENAGTYTLTLKDSCKTLMAEEGAIDELDGKTYDAYITDIGWNLA